MQQHKEFNGGLKEAKEFQCTEVPGTGPAVRARKGQNELFATAYSFVNSY